MARILIVEDDPASRDYLRTLLTATHHKVSEASDGAEALKTAQSEQPDVIITDILMPTMDGFDFVRQLRKDTLLASTPVIFCSASYLQRESQALAKACGVTHILLKPAEPQEVDNAIQDVLLQHQDVGTLPDEEFHRQHADLVSHMALRKSAELQIANDRLEALIAVGNELASEPDAKQLIQKFCKGARYVLGARYSAVVLRVKDETKTELAATSGLPENASSHDAFLSLAQIASRELRPNKKTVLVYDNSQLSMFAPPTFLDPVRACVAIAISSGAKLYGFLLAAGKVGQQDFSEEDEQVARTLAAQVAIAYENVLRVDRLRAEVGERKRVEESLRRSEARNRELIENTTYGIFRSAPEGKFLEVNPALVRILGYESAAEVNALDFATDIYRDPAERAVVIQKFKNEGRVHGVEVHWKKKDGTPILVRLSGRIVPRGSSEPACFEIIAEDITELRALEKSNRQLQKFEAIGQLAGGIAHDFNNVIGAIMGWSELGLPETTPDSRVRTYLEKIGRQAERAARLTKQLLAFARRQILEPRSIKLNEVVVETMEFLKPVIGANIDVKLVLAPDLEMTHADSTQIEQALMNLSLNARDAMPQGGELLIETKNVTFDKEYCRRHPYARPGSFVLLSVSDTGQGMDRATMEHIFEPFFTTKEMGKGTGLGLATVYGIVKQHGGFIHVYSEPGQGSAFHAYLPKTVDESQPRETRTQLEPVCGGTETILVAEDQEGNLEIAKEILEKLGYTVLCAANGEAAARLFESNSERIALVVLDVLMPKLSGPDAFGMMRNRKPGLPVLFTTGFSPELTNLELLTRQGAEILQKPYGPNALSRRVREILDRNAPTKQ